MQVGWAANYCLWICHPLNLIFSFLALREITNIPPISMENLHFQFILFLLFLLQFLSLLLLSSPTYTPPPKYFMNCGSKSNFKLGDRTFVGDQNSDSTFFVGKSKPISSINPLPGNPPELYVSARIYRQLSFYELDISDEGTYLVRLHFFPFSSGGTNLSDASFDVSASNFSLLSNFSVRNCTDFPVIEEFMLTINAGKFKIYFIPANATSFAFVNAMEVFILPTNFTMDKALAVPPLGNKDGFFNGLLSRALKKRYRINVGGSELNDSLWRNWVSDDDYLILRGSAINSSYYIGELTMVPGELTVEEIAPEQVYRTCKVVKANDSEANSFSNTTWRFDVRNNTRHLVRLHFCDFYSLSPGTVKFDLYMYTNFRYPIDPNGHNISEMASPFYYDFVAASDDSGYMNISIAPREDSSNKIAFLNGLEIMEFVMNNTGILEPMKDKTNKRLFLLVGSVGGLALIVIVVSLFLSVWRWKKAKSVKALVLKTEPPYGRGGSDSWITETADYASPLPNLNLKLKMTLAEILDATQNFHTEFLIGEGGFGKVYKGTLRNGMKVAVKRSDSSHGQGRPEFQTEVMVLSKIQHRHLVSLIGYCDEGSEMILVYEFMEKGTLRDHLYNWKENSKKPSTQPELTWKQRLEICIGSAKGLHYLHTGLDGGILHRDVKSTNILLDENYVAKVADFGLSQSGALDPDHFSMGVKGSFGYLDPEYFRTLQLTGKSDVYSFGVVLLEVLCARPPIINSPRREEINLAEWGLSWLKKGQLEKIIDPLLVGCINPNSLRKFGEIAEKCLKPEATGRPSMLDVSWDLEYALQLQQSAVHKEPDEDSTTDASSVLVLSTIQRLSSDSFPSEEDNLSTGANADSDIMASGVLSQPRIDGTT